MIYPVVAFGSPMLKKVGIEVPADYFDLKKLSEDMFETMRSANGVGLAAPQIGKSMRMFVVSYDGFDQVFVNPEIIDEYGEQCSIEEGCLSIPSIKADVLRSESVKVRYFDEEWNQYENVFDGITARIIQHEYDHINGVLFTDHLNSLKKRLFKKKLTNISKGKVAVNYNMKFPSK